MFPLSGSRAVDCPWVLCRNGGKLHGDNRQQGDRKTPSNKIIFQFLQRTSDAKKYYFKQDPCSTSTNRPLRRSINRQHLAALIEKWAAPDQLCRPAHSKWSAFRAGRLRYLKRNWALAPLQNANWAPNLCATVGRRLNKDQLDIFQLNRFGHHLFLQTQLYPQIKWWIKSAPVTSHQFTEIVFRARSFVIWGWEDLHCSGEHHRYFY